MRVETTNIADLFIITPTCFNDSRGYFLETYHQQRYNLDGKPIHFVQDNHSRSQKNVLRGLHYQLTQAQGKLVYVTRGKIFDVAVDIRQGSATFGEYFSLILDDEKHQQLYIPPGFAHGFCTLSETADVVYKCTNFYCPQAERGIIWNDKTLNIHWPIKNPLLSTKDAQYPNLQQLQPTNLPVYKEKNVSVST